MLFDKVVDEISRFFVLQFSLADTGSREKLFQFWIDVFQIESSIRIPSYMTDMLKVCRQTDVFFLQPAFLVAFLSLAEVVVRRLIRRR